MPLPGIGTATSVVMPSWRQTERVLQAGRGRGRGEQSGRKASRGPHLQRASIRSNMPQWTREANVACVGRGGSMGMVGRRLMLASPSAAKSHDKSVRKNAEPVERAWSRVILILPLQRSALSGMAFPALAHLPRPPLHLARSLALLHFHHEPCTRAIRRASFEPCLLRHISSSRHMPALVRTPVFRN